MAGAERVIPPGRGARDLKVALASGGFALFMLGMAFAAVPLYDWFCRVTGFGGTTMVATSTPTAVGERMIKVRFDANIAPGLPWRFTPEVAAIELRTGETRTVSYTVAAVGDRSSVGIASYNVTPEIAGQYFNKIACFCFTDQELKPGERREEPVVFFIDPAIEKDPNLRHVHTITLSYTFHPSKTPPRPEAAVTTGAGG
jgi:cytochrome c oxidase assembly protein subunit 11